MKCDELKYEKLGDMMPFYPRSTLVIRKQFVDAAIAELKDRIHELESMPHTDNSAVIDALETENAELKAENRKRQRSLWLARATIAHSTRYKYHCLASKAEIDPQPHGWSCYINGEVYRTGKMNRMLEPHYWIELWEEVEHKCRAKSEEYK